MNFNGKTLIIIGSILFFFQLGNFFSIDSISPALTKSTSFISYIVSNYYINRFLFKQFNPKSGERVELKGENKFIYNPDMPSEILEELAWGSEAILTSTAAASILIHNDGKNILQRGITSNDHFNLERNLFEIYKRYEISIIS